MAVQRPDWLEVNYGQKAAQSKRVNRNFRNEIERYDYNNTLAAALRERYDCHARKVPQRMGTDVNLRPTASSRRCTSRRSRSGRSVVCNVSSAPSAPRGPSCPWVSRSTS
jgi:hypothetical protein